MIEAPSTRVRVATFGDGSQVLVEEWTDAAGTPHGTAATRPHRDARWGPPVGLLEGER